MPCFPSKKDKVIRPHDAGMPLKNVNRYGETNVRSVGSTLKPEEWRKGGKFAAHTKTQQDDMIERRVSRRPPTGACSPRHHEDELYSSMPREYASPPQQQPKRRADPVHSDFFISVPIFNETLNHSYRKKNEFVFRRNDEAGSVMHDSLSRASSLKSLNTSGTVPVHSDRVGSTRQAARRRPRSLQRYDSGSARHSRHRQASGSEASYNTTSSYSYESERLEAPRVLRAKHRRAGLNIDSDDDDTR